MNNYIITKSFENLNDQVYEVGTPLQNHGGALCFGDKFIFMAHSENARNHSVGNDDGEWQRRRELIDKINGMISVDLTRETYDEHSKKIEKLWSYSKAMKYCKGGSPETDAWIWNDNFYCATIRDLELILKFITTK